MSLKKLFKPFKLVSIAKKVGVVTVLYPFQKPLITSEFRGKISIDPSICMGCGACANVCPPNALILTYRDDTVVLNYFIGRCIFCGRCAEICPAGAITVTNEFELASFTIGDLNEAIIHTQAECHYCGSRYRLTPRMKQFVIQRVPSAENYIHLCTDCRKKLFIYKAALGRGVSGGREEN